MTAAERRFQLLAWLAWDLRQMERSTTIVTTGHGRPMLYLPLPGGPKLPIVAADHDAAWYFLSSERTVRIEATEGAAGRFMSAVAA